MKHRSALQNVLCETNAIYDDLDYQATLSDEKKPKEIKHKF